MRRNGESRTPSRPTSVPTDGAGVEFPGKIGPPPLSPSTFFEHDGRADVKRLDTLTGSEHLGLHGCRASTNTSE